MKHLWIGAWIDGFINRLIDDLANGDNRWIDISIVERMDCGWNNDLTD